VDRQACCPSTAKSDPSSAKVRKLRGYSALFVEQIDATCDNDRVLLCAGRPVMSIDLAVSRAVSAVRALETAVHDSGPWSLELAGMIIPVHREIADDGVAFTGTFPSTSGGFATLYCRGVHVRVVGPFDAVDHPFEVCVELSLPTGVSA
jgi:hypothetical protein